MVFTKKESELKTYDVLLTEGSKSFSILFAGNGDLYWILRNSDGIDASKQTFLHNKRKLWCL